MSRLPDVSIDTSLLVDVGAAYQLHHVVVNYDGWRIRFDGWQSRRYRTHEDAVKVFGFF